MREGLLVRDASADAAAIAQGSSRIGRFLSFRVRAALLVSLALILFFVLFWVNVFLLTKVPFNFKDLITIIIFSFRRSSDVSDVIVDSLSVEPVQRSLWICLASTVASVALVIGGSWIQSLTQNPLADTTTLGFISSSIFGIILMKGVISNVIEASNYHILYFVFALLGGIITIFILSFLFLKPQNKQQHLKIVLIGLVLNMIFNTFTYLIKTYNSNAVNASFALAMGGAENIYGLYTQKFTSLKWCAIFLAAIFVFSCLFSRNLNIYELGEDQAKTLGVNVRMFKCITYIVILLTTTIAILLVGNIAFLGLICTHAVRMLLGTSKYQVILPVGSLLACVLLLFGSMINSFFPFISSSIFTLMLGGIVLLGLTLKS